MEKTMQLCRAEEMPCFMAILPEALGSAGNGMPAPVLERHGSVAVLPVRGVLDKERMRALAALLQKAAEDGTVRAVMLDVDSPGGTVDGTEEFAAAVRTANAAKPVYAYADGMMCSAAYWVASQARELAAPETAQVGSIGVIAVHTEYSSALQEWGVKVTVLSAGRYKAAGNAWEPLDEEMRAYLQEGIDQAYGVFLRAVAQGRGITVEQAALMAEGRVYAGLKALEAGLVDRVESRADFLTHIQRSIAMSQEKQEAAQQPPHGAAAAQDEAAAAAASACGEAAACAADESQSAQAQDAERIYGLAMAVFGEEAGARFCELARSGMDERQYKAALEAAGAAGNAARLADLRAARSAVVIDPLEAAAEQADFESLVLAGMKSGKSRAQAVRAAVESNAAAYDEWLRKQKNI